MLLSIFIIPYIAVTSGTLSSFVKNILPWLVLFCYIDIFVYVFMHLCMRDVISIEDMKLLRLTTKWLYSTMNMTTLNWSMQQIVRSAKGIGGAQGKYKNWGSLYRLCEGGLEARPLENFNALKCIPRSSEALFRACYSTYIHTYLQVLLPSSFGGFRNIRWTWFELQHKREAKMQADLKSTIQRNDPLREGRLGSMWMMN